MTTTNPEGIVMRGRSGKFRRWASSSASIADWVRSDVVIPRWLLTIDYGFRALIGVAVIFASQPTIELLTGSAGWTTAWGWGVTIFATGSLIGSLSPSKANERLERFCSVGLMSLFIIYAFAPLYVVIVNGDWDRASLAIVAIALSVVPFARMLALLRSTGTVKPCDEQRNE